MNTTVLLKSHRRLSAIGSDDDVHNIFLLLSCEHLKERKAAEDHLRE